jgi:hypothetical protein
MRLDRAGDRGGKGLAAHRQAAAGGHGGFPRAAHQQGTHRLHLALEDPRGAVGQVRAQRIAANQFAQVTRHVRAGLPPRPHFEQTHLVAALGHLPGGLAAGQAAADNRHKRFVHFLELRGGRGRIGTSDGGHPQTKIA